MRRILIIDISYMISIRLLQSFVHGMIAVMIWHVQNIAVINFITTWKAWLYLHHKLINISMVSELWSLPNMAVWPGSHKGAPCSRDSGDLWHGGKANSESLLLHHHKLTHTTDCKQGSPPAVIQETMGYMGTWFLVIQPKENTENSFNGFPHQYYQWCNNEIIPKKIHVLIVCGCQWNASDTSIKRSHTVYPMVYPHCFVVLCFVLVILWICVNHSIRAHTRHFENGILGAYGCTANMIIKDIIHILASNCKNINILLVGRHYRVCCIQSYPSKLLHWHEQDDCPSACEVTPKDMYGLKAIFYQNKMSVNPWDMLNYVWTPHKESGRKQTVCWWYFNAMRWSDTYMCQQTKSSLVQIMTCNCLVPSQYLKQYWLNVNWILINTLQWNWNQNTKTVIEEINWKWRLQNIAQYVGASLS